MWLIIAGYNIVNLLKSFSIKMQIIALGVDIFTNFTDKLYF